MWPKAQAPEPGHPQTTMGLSDAFLWLVVAQVGSIPWAVLVLQVMEGTTSFPDEVPISTRAVLQLAFVAAYGIGPIVWASRRGRGPAAELGTTIVPTDVPIGFVLGLVTQLVILPVLYFPILRFVDSDPAEVAEQLTALAQDNLDRALLILIVVVAAPIVEEIFFRGLLMRVLMRFMATWAAVLLQALIFAAVHFQTLQFPGLFVFGLLAGVVTAHYGRLGPAWAMHAAFNGVTLALLL